MTRSHLAKSKVIEDDVLLAAARARRRALSLIHCALKSSGLEQVELAESLGLKKSSVSAVLHGNGNLNLNTLAEYMGALGYEVDLVATRLGELESAQEQRRPPVYVVLTNSDLDRVHESRPEEGPQIGRLRDDHGSDWRALVSSRIGSGENVHGTIAMGTWPTHLENKATNTSKIFWSNKAMAVRN